MSHSRRGFIASLFAAPAALAAAQLDPDKLLWIPGRKLISIPAPAPSPIYLRFVRQYNISTDSFVAWFDMSFEKMRLANDAAVTQALLEFTDRRDLSPISQRLNQVAGPLAPTPEQLRTMVSHMNGSARSVNLQVFRSLKLYPPYPAGRFKPVASS